MSTEIRRCEWAAHYGPFGPYHDTEWGFPVGDDIHLFEKLCLESFQSGLSWRTILDKRENFRAAFDGFDFNIMADYGRDKIEALLEDSGIIRHRGKIEAVINNAARTKDIVTEFGTLARYIWQYEPSDQGIAPRSRTACPESHALSRDLKKRGWKFVGPTTMYAFMQSMGLVNDHDIGCTIGEAAERARAAFARP